MRTFPKQDFSVGPNHYSQQQQLPQLHHPHHQRTKSSDLPNSRIILIPETSSFVPDSRTGSSIRLSQSQQQLSPPTTTTTLTTTASSRKSPRRRRRLFCDGKYKKRNSL